MHARALDNCISIVASSRAGGCGVWDTEGKELLPTARAEDPAARFKDIVKLQVEGLDILVVTLDLNFPPTGGTRAPAIRTKRHLANQRSGLEDRIRREKSRWWVD